MGPAIADVQARLHDPEAAELAVKTKGDTNDPSVAAITHFVHGRLAAEAGDDAQAVTEMEAFGTAFASPFVSTNYPGYNCWIALAEEAAGNAAKADAVLQTRLEPARTPEEAPPHSTEAAGPQILCCELELSTPLRLFPGPRLRLRICRSAFRVSACFSQRFWPHVIGRRKRTALGNEGLEPLLLEGCEDIYRRRAVDAQVGDGPELDLRS